MVAMLGDAMIYLVGLALRYWLWAANVAGDRPEVLHLLSYRKSGIATSDVDTLIFPRWQLHLTRIAG